MAARGFPNWEELYRQESPDRMPWYYPELDPDLRRALDERKLASGTILDLGTGPGTQAMALSELGFDVTATDVSATAVDNAAERAARRGVAVRFVRDDVLDTHLRGPFDLAFDRGCFHVLSPADRPRYVATLAKLLRPAGFLFLKCFSDQEPGSQGPYRFSTREIRAAFEPAFEIISVQQTVYHGTRVPLPRALFCVLRRGQEASP